MKKIFVIVMIFALSGCMGEKSDNLISSEEIVQSIDSNTSINLVLNVYESGEKRIAGNLVIDNGDAVINCYIEETVVKEIENEINFTAEGVVEASYKEAARRVSETNGMKLSMTIEYPYDDQRRTVTYSIDFTDRESIIYGSILYLYEERPEIYEFSISETSETEAVLSMKVRDKKDGELAYGEMEMVTINWGDTTEEEVLSNFEAIELPHIYSDQGVYLITVTAEDVDGLTMIKKGYFGEEKESGGSEVTGGFFLPWRGYLTGAAISHMTTTTTVTYSGITQTIESGEYKEYDAYGKPIRIIHWEDTTSNITQIDVIEYDSSDHVVMETVYNSSGTAVLSYYIPMYDSNGYLYEALGYDDSGAYEGKTVFTWNSSKNVELIEFLNETDGLEIQTEYIYDSGGRIESIVTTDFDPYSVIEMEITEYTSSGWPYKLFYSSSMSGYENTVEITYYYD